MFHYVQMDWTAELAAEALKSRSPYTPSVYGRYAEDFLWDFDEVTIARIHAIVHDEVERFLTPHGFEPVSDLKWVRGRDAPIRQVFSFKRWWGGVFGPQWGLSLDFIPHLSGGAVAWHRSDKTARQDLCAHAVSAEMQMNRCNGDGPIRRDHRRITAAAMSEAAAFWAALSCLEKLPSGIAELEARILSGEWYGGQNIYALIFVAARAGRFDEAQAALEKELANCPYSKKTSDRLRRLLVEAGADPLPPPRPIRLGWLERAFRRGPAPRSFSLP